MSTQYLSIHSPFDQDLSFSESKMFSSQVEHFMKDCESEKDKETVSDLKYRYHFGCSDTSFSEWENTTITEYLDVFYDTPDHLLLTFNVWLRNRMPTGISDENELQESWSLKWNVTEGDLGNVCCELSDKSEICEWLIRFLTHFNYDVSDIEEFDDFCFKTLIAYKSTRQILTHKDFPLNIFLDTVKLPNSEEYLEGTLLSDSPLDLGKEVPFEAYYPVMSKVMKCIQFQRPELWTLAKRFLHLPEEKYLSL